MAMRWFEPFQFLSKKQLYSKTFENGVVWGQHKSGCSVLYWEVVLIKRDFGG